MTKRKSLIAILSDKVDMIRGAFLELRAEHDNENTPVLRFKKLRPDAVSPFVATAGSAGMDLVGFDPIYENGIITYSTGLAFEIPEGYAGLIFPRSSIKNRPLVLSNSVGVIDADYRGEVKVAFRVVPQPKDEGPYKTGERICQLVLLKIPTVSVEEVTELSSTVRGEGGFGSTGK